jgi:metal-responsive CopG/Arc/MetJ family transcriptional regulator
MKTIQMTLDEELVDAVDKIVKKLKTTRSAFTRDALRDALNQINVDRLELKHKKGYEKHPIGNSEFDEWDSEQEWGEV